MPVIYLDVLVALNFLIDYLLLSATARILRHPCKRWRMVLSALFGGFFACSILLPAMSFAVQMAVRLVACAMMVLVAFVWNGIMPFAKQIAVLFIVSALFAGLSSALWFYLAPQGFYVFNGVVYYDVSPLLLTALSVICYGVVCLYDRLTHRYRSSKKTRYDITVRCEKGEVTLPALLDTGHHVTETFSGQPVVMVSRAAVENILPTDMLPAWKGAVQPSSATAVKWRIRMVPCQTVGGTALLPAICPIGMQVSDGCGQTKDITGAYVAVCERLGRGDYQALIGSDVADLFT